jgi:hypothetical protein
MPIDLKAVSDRVSGLGFFNDVGDAAAASEAMTNFIARPPAAYVSTASERAGPNKLSTGWRQKVVQTVSVLFVMGIERADQDLSDCVEAARLLIINALTGWRPEGADSPFHYVSYSMRFAGEGLIWGECLFAAPYHRTLLP